MYRSVEWHWNLKEKIMDDIKIEIMPHNEIKLIIGGIENILRYEEGSIISV